MKTDGRMGFYRAYSPRVFDTLEEAIEWTMLLADEYGLAEVEVLKRVTRTYPNGGWFVGLVGKKKPDGEVTVPAGMAPLP
jgi:hypothetical protein